MASDEKAVDKAVEEVKKEHIRQVVRENKAEDGWPLIATAEELDEHGESVEVYKLESSMGPEDYEKVIRFHLERSLHHNRMAEGYRMRADKRFGKS
jgi:hypothetical protein